MDNKKLKLILSTIILFSITFNAFSHEDFYSSGFDPFIFDYFMITHLPGGYFYPSFIENYAPDTTFLIEENNGFSMIDNPRVYYEGDSFVNFNWFYNGLNLNSILNAGAPAVLLPFSSITNYRLQGETPLYRDYGLSFTSDFQEKTFSKVLFSSVYTDLGSYSPWGPAVVFNHASNRSDLLYSERRKILNNYFVDYLLNKKFKNSYLLFSVNYFDIKRKFNDFNKFNNTFEEKGELFLLNSRYRRKIKNGSMDFFAVFNSLNRSNHNAEIGRYPQETYEKRRYSFFSGAILKKKKLNIKLSFIYESENINPNEINFSKDLKDNDGEGFYPYYRMGKFSGKSLNFNVDIPFKINFNERALNFFAFVDFKISNLTGKEDVHDFNSILFDKNPYLVIKWNRGDSYKNLNTLVNMGLNFTVDVSNNLSLFGKLFLKYNNLNFETNKNNLSSINPGFDFGLLLFKNKSLRIFLAYGLIPYDLRSNMNFFLEKNRPYGTIYRWNDINSDSLYQNGEQREVFGYTGGKYHFLDKDISIPLKSRLLLGISTRISKKFVLNIKGIFKKVINNFWVKHNQNYGFYEKHKNYDIFFYTEPFKDYYLSNSNFKKDPFYAQILFNLKGGEKNKWFYSFSFLAHMGMGYTSFGNGAGSNDIGIVGESQANPNSWINGYGRLDGDRAFVAKMYFGFYILKKLYVGVSLKYRDGNPFAFFDTLYKQNQWVVYYQTIKAENEKGVKGGPREDYLSDISLKFNYNFRLFKKEAKLSLSLFNIFDFGSELSEYVFSGGSRDAMELQIPRSIRFTLSCIF